MNSIEFQYEYTVQGYSTFHVKVISEVFSGETNFCTPIGTLSTAVDALKTMYKNLCGQCQITDVDSDDYVKFEFLSLGHLRISGQLGGSFNDQYLKFQFESDQTALKCVIDSLKFISSN